MPDQKPLGRRVPTDFEHVRLWRLTDVQPQTVTSVEKKLSVLTDWRRKYDQGREGACVGFSSSMMMSILNRMFYDAPWLYHEAQNRDEWSDTPPEEGTSVRAAMDVLRDVGHRRVLDGVSQAPLPAFGIAANRWATDVNELRTCIANGSPFVLGTNWYTNFDTPTVKRIWFGLVKEYWIGEGPLGSIRGGHAICCYAASDKRQAFGLVNSWGLSYPLVWMPYTTMQRLLNEQGEATVITDR